MVTFALLYAGMLLSIFLAHLNPTLSCQGIPYQPTGATWMAFCLLHMATFTSDALSIPCGTNKIKLLHCTSVLHRDTCFLWD